MTVEEFRAKLAAAGEESERLTARMKAAGADPEALYPPVRSYLCLKFMLDEAEAEGDNITALAARSIEQIAGLRKDGLVFADHSGTCAAVSSAVTKKILLLIALQKALGIRFPRDRTAEIDSIPRLCVEIAEQLAGGRDGE